MSAPVKQVVCDHDAWDGETPAADPSPYTVDVDWSTAFEFGGAR